VPCSQFLPYTDQLLSTRLAIRQQTFEVCIDLAHPDGLERKIHEKDAPRVEGKRLPPKAEPFSNGIMFNLVSNLILLASGGIESL